MLAELAQGMMPDKMLLRRRFDMALTKKMGVISLPSAFWMNDPKINPRGDHLFWAALLLLDRQRIDLALSVLAAEQAERLRSSGQERIELAREAQELLCGLLGMIGDERLRGEFRRDLALVAPGLFEGKKCCRAQPGVGYGH